jgi:predicted dehydrogenase
MDKPLPVGIIGCGAIAQISHIPCTLEHQEKFRLLAVSEIAPGVLQAVAERYRIPGAYIDYRDLLARKDIEAVIICHSGSHHDSILAALEAGKHVFTEKPVAWNLREVEEVAARARASDRIVQVGYHKLYDPGFAHARKEVQDMPDLALCRISVLHPANELGLSAHRIRRGDGLIVEGHVDPGTWEYQVAMQQEGLSGGALAPLVDEALGSRRADPRLRLGYGILTLSIIHQVYTMFAFLGEPLRVVSTEIWRDGLSIHILVEYPADRRCTIDWHFLSHLKDYREEYAFYGNSRRVIMQLPSPYFFNFPSPVIVQGGEGELAWEKKIIVSYEEAFRKELLAFHENIRQNRQPATTVLDAVKHSRFIQEAIDQAR